WSGEVASGVTADVGVTYYAYPNAGPGKFDYVEFYGSVGFTLGPAEATVGVAYAPDQASLGNTDNIYGYVDVSTSIPNTPVSINGHIGYTDGFLTFTDNSKAWDWSVGADLALTGNLTVGAKYVGAE